MEEIRIAGLKEIEEIEKTPLSERIEHNSTYECIRAGAAINPEKPAVYFFLDGDMYENPTIVTYAQLLGRINQTANLLRDLGVGHKDVVSILLPNIPHSHFAIWGGEAQAIAGPINPLLEPLQIRDILRAGKTKALITLGQFPGADIWEKVESIRKDLPDLEHIIRVMGPSDEKNGIIGFDQVIDKYNPGGLDSNRQFDPEDLASVFHTGGTTGTPKLAPHTHANEVFIIKIINTLVHFSDQDTLMCGLPLFHVNGVLVTGGAPFSIGASVVLLTPQGYRNQNSIKNFFKIVEKYKISFFSCVPTVLSTLLQIPVEGVDISSLKFVICGAAPLAVETFNAFERHTDMKILEGYGLTEGGVASSINPPYGDRIPGAVGIRFPYQPMKTVVLDDDGNYVRDCATDEIGVVAIKGPNVFPGYFEEEHNKGVWLPDGFFNTGDLGRIDERGYLYLTGRKKDLIIRGGHNIDPSMIEEPLVQMPGVSLAAAVPRPDRHAGEVPVAYVQLDPGADLTEEQIREFAAKNIGERAAVPKAVYIVDAIPLTAVGKIFKPELRRDAIRRTFEEELAALGEEASARVEVEQDKLHGTLARVFVTPAEGADPEAVRARVEELLALFTVRYEINVQ